MAAYFGCDFLLRDELSLVLTLQQLKVIFYTLLRPPSLQVLLHQYNGTAPHPQFNVGGFAESATSDIFSKWTLQSYHTPAFTTYVHFSDGCELLVICLERFCGALITYQVVLFLPPWPNPLQPLSTSPGGSGPSCC